MASTSQEVNRRRTEYVPSWSSSASKDLVNEQEVVASTSNHQDTTSSKVSSSESNKKAGKVEKAEKAERPVKARKKAQKEHQEAEIEASQVPAVIEYKRETVSRNPPIDTHQIFNTLLEAKIDADAAQALTYYIRDLMQERLNDVYRDRVGRQENENAASFFKAALHEMRSEIAGRQHAHTQNIRMSLDQLKRETEILDSLLKEGLETLKRDIQLDTNQRRNENKELQQQFDHSIQNYGRDYTISLGDSRVKFESVRWLIVSETIAAIAFGIALWTLLYWLTEPTPAPPVPPEPRIPTNRDLGIEEQDLREVVGDDRI